MTLVPTTKGKIMTSRYSDDRQGRTTNDTRYCGFTVGQHVVCVSEMFQKAPHHKRNWERRGVRFPVVNTVYTVRQLIATPKGIGLLLAEIHNPLVPVRDFGRVEAFSPTNKFRPLKKLKVEDFMSINAPSKREGASA